MPSSDYGNAVGGGLKLKGAKDAGVKKHKKKKKHNTEDAVEGEKELQIEKSDAQKALAEEDDVDGGDEVERRREEDVKEYGKTEAQRRHEERRKKRVCSLQATLSVESVLTKFMCLARRATQTRRCQDA